MNQQTFERLLFKCTKKLIINYCINHGIPSNVIESAINYYLICIDEDIITDNTRIGIMSFCIHKACQDNDISSNVYQIAYDLRITLGTIFSVCTMHSRL